DALPISNACLELRPRVRILTDQASDPHDLVQKLIRQLPGVVTRGVPLDSFVDLGLGFEQETHAHGQPVEARRSRTCRTLARSRSIISSKSTSDVSPRSSAAIRRFTSAIQAALISSVANPSPMLAMSIVANSARSASGNCMAASRIRLASSVTAVSVAPLVIDPEKYRRSCRDARGPRALGTVSGRSVARVRVLPWSG